MNALHWSPSRSVVRDAAVDRDERQIARQFGAHNAACREAECLLNVLESALCRRIEFAIEPRERFQIVQLSMPAGRL